MSILCDFLGDEGVSPTPLAKQPRGVSPGVRVCTDDNTRGWAWVKLGDVDACKMHAYSLFSHIPTYLHVMICYIHVLH
jgi:hypothetical protein